MGIYASGSPNFIILPHWTYISIPPARFWGVTSNIIS